MEREKYDFPMKDYNFDKPIKISYIFEDSQSDKTDKFESLQLPKNLVQCSSAKNNNNTNSATELLNTTLSADHNCYSNTSFDEMETGLNIDHDSKAYTEGGSSRDTQNRHTVIPSAISNPHMSLREKVTNRTLEHNYLTSNENMQHLHLLDTVSENLIMIFKYYHFYSIQYANTKNKNAIENYLNNKEHYYKQSYRVTVDVLLPQEHNHVFIRNFINRTIHIANRKSWYHNMSISSLEPLVYGMIKWAKLKKNTEVRKYNQLHQLLSREPPPSYSITSANIRQQPMNVQAPVSLGTLKPPAPSASNCCPASNTYAQQPTSGPPVAFLRSDLAVKPPSCSITDINTGHTVRRPPPIALPPSVPLPPASNSFININTQQPMTGVLSISLVPSNQPGPRPPLNNSSNNNSRKPTNLPLLISLAPSVLSEQQATRSFTNVVTQQQMTKAPVSVLPVPSESNSIITNSTTNGGIHADLDNSVRLFSTGPPGSEISISIDGTIANVANDIKSSKKNRKSLHTNQTRKKRKTDDIKSPNILSTRSALRPHIQNQVQQNNRNCDSQNQPPITSNVHSANTSMQPTKNVNSNQLCPGGMQNRKGDCDNYCQSPLSRSESRDSGFGSPILSTLTPTNDYNTVYSHCTNQDLTPEIIHVTSMHPDAVFIANGTCRICGKTTKNKCIACYKEYYCGTKCQTADWPHHMLECRPRFLI